jgi:hypothetical protein
MKKTKKINKQTLLLGGLLVILIFSSFLYNPVIANGDDDDDDGIPDHEEDDEDDDGIHDHEEEENEREIQIEVSDYEASIESRSTSGGIENEFNVDITADNEGLEFDFEFEKEADSEEIEIEFSVLFYEIIEYIDSSADGYYNESIDEVVQIYEINDFVPINYTNETISNDTVHRFRIETSDGIFSAETYVTSNFTPINDILIAPTQLKIDIGIHSFNYSEPNSALALKVNMDSEFEVDFEDDEETEDEENGRVTDEHEVEISLGDFKGFFSWIEIALIDGVERAVNATPIEIDEEESKLYLSYPRGNEIIHDPKIGIAGVLIPPSTAGPIGINSSIELPKLSRNELLIVSSIVLFTLTGLVLVFRRRN